MRSSADGSAGDRRRTGAAPREGAARTAEAPPRGGKGGRGRRGGAPDSALLVKHAFELAREAGVQKLLLQADELVDADALESARGREAILWLTTDRPGALERARGEDRVVEVPDVALTRVGRVKLGLFIALVNGYVRFDEGVLAVSGLHGSRRLDTLVAMSPRRDFPWFRHGELSEAARAVPIGVLERVIQVALRLGAEGREGKPIGTILVVGDPAEIGRYGRQLVLNPCKGHARRLRQIQNPEFLESLRELAVLDGAIVIDRRGVAESAGTYLDVRAPSTRVRAGLGARHHAAASITHAADCVALVVSESSGGVTLFYRGRAVLELEREGGGPTRSGATRG